MLTLHEHLGSPSIIGGVRVYPSRAPGFILDYWWGSYLPFTSTWVHPPLLVGFVFTLHEHLGSPSIIGGVRAYLHEHLGSPSIIGRVRVYPSRAPGFTLDYWWRSSLPFTSTWVLPPLLVGFVFTLHEHLGCDYPSRAPGFSLHYWWGSCLPFTSTWVHPRLLVGSSLPFTSTWVLSPLMVGFVFTLHEHLGSPSIIGGVRVYPSRAPGFSLH